MSSDTSGQAPDTWRTRTGHGRTLSSRRSFQPTNILLNPAVCLVVILELLFVAFECGRVDVAAAVDDADGMGDVEHFVENYVIDYISRHFDRIERAADGDVVERAVVMAENAIGLAC